MHYIVAREWGGTWAAQRRHLNYSLKQVLTKPCPIDAGGGQGLFEITIQTRLKEPLN